MIIRSTVGELRVNTHCIGKVVNVKVTMGGAVGYLAASEYGKTNCSNIEL